MAELPLKLVVCDHCGLAHRWTALAPGAQARCTRCDGLLGHGHRMDVQALLALTVAAALVFLIAHGSHVITIRLAGAELRTTVPMAILAAWHSGEHLVALLAGVTAVLAPALFIGIRLYLLLPLALGRVPAGLAPCLRLLFQVSRWNTVEVLTVAALLALVRIAALAQASAGPGLLALAALAVLLAALETAGLRHLWWRTR
jgi:paraquat-inducible protein A